MYPFAFSPTIRRNADTDCNSETSSLPLGVVRGMDIDADEAGDASCLQPGSHTYSHSSHSYCTAFVSQSEFRNFEASFLNTEQLELDILPVLEKDNNHFKLTEFTRQIARGDLRMAIMEKLNNKMTASSASTSIATAPTADAITGDAGKMVYPSTPPPVAVTTGEARVDKMIVHFCCDFFNGADFACFQFLRFAGFDSKKALDRMASAIVWLHVDMWRTLAPMCDLGQCGVSGDAQDDEHACTEISARARIGFANSPERALLISAGTQTIQRTMIGGTYSHRERKDDTPEKSVVSKKGEEDLEALGLNRTPQRSPARPFRRLKKKAEAYKIDLDFDFEESPPLVGAPSEAMLSSSLLAASCSANVSAAMAFSAPQRRYMASKGTQTIISYPDCSISLERGMGNNVVTFPAVTHFDAFSIKLDWMSSKVFQTRSGTVEIARLAPMLESVGWKARPSSTASTNDRSYPVGQPCPRASVCARLTFLQLRKMQRMRDFGTTGCVFLLDCKDVGLFSLARAARNFYEDRTAILEILTNIPGGVNGCLLYNCGGAMSAAAAVLARLLWRSPEDRARLRTCPGMPSERNLNEIGIASDKFAEIETSIGRL
ncbi:unnamed protein product [Amoebophrya sp. A25]|nr:unnamed protein product [Amoebophrya sp. A25]|eukprot:GSA25T00005733001.1